MKQVMRLSMLSLAFVIAAIALVVGAVGSAAAVTCTDSWDGGAGTLSWQDAANWSTNVLPAATDNVCLPTTANVTSASDVTIKYLNQSAGSLTINGGTFSLTDTGNSSSVANLTLAGGSLAGAAAVTTTGAITWSGGFMSGSGATTIASGGTLTLTTANGHYLDRTLNIQAGGNAVDLDTGGVGVTTNTVINLAGTWDDQTDTGAFVFSGTGQMNVLTGGVFKKSGGTANSVFNINLDNDGTVQALSGQLTVLGGSGLGNTSTGSFSATAGHTLALGAQDMSGAASVTGAGTIQASAGIINFAGTTWNVTGSTDEVNGAQINFNTPGSTTNGTQNGTIGGSSTFTVRGTYTWVSGNMVDSGTTGVTSFASGSHLTINSANNHFLGRNLTIQSGGSAVLTDTGILYTNTGAILNVAGTFDVQTDTGIAVNNAAGQMNVLSGGLLKKSAGVGTSGFNIAVDNDGSVQALSGTLYLSAGSGTAHSSTGSFSATSGNTLAFGGDTQDMSGAASVTGAGTIQQVNGTTTFGGTTWNVTGQTNVSGGTVNFNTAASTVNGTQTGAIGGSGVFTVTGTYTWTGGNMQDTGTTSFGAASHLTINSGNNHFLGRTLTIASGGSGVLTDTGILYTNTGAILNVAGTFDVQTDTGIAVNNAAGQMNVLSGGLLKKSAGVGTSGFNIAVDNDGSVQALSGTLYLSAGSGTAHSSTGSFSATSGNTLAFGGDTQDMSGAASVTGAGTIQQVNGTTTFGGTTWNVTGQTNVSGGTVNFNTAASTVNGTQTGAIGGSGVFTVTGTYTWTGGNMQDTGTTSFGAASHLTINSGNNHFLGRTLTIASGGSGVLTDTGVLYTNTGAVLNVAGTFDVQSDTGIAVNNAAGQMNVLSGGLLKKSAGVGTSGFNIAVDNDGSVQALSGTLYLSAGSGTAHSSTGSFSATSGNTLAFGGDTQDMSGAASVTGAGTIQQVNGSTTFAGTTWNVTGQTNVSGGTLNFNTAASTVNGTQTGAIGGSAVFTISGTYTWSGGNMQDAGTTSIGSAGLMTINTGNNHFLGRTLSVLSGGKVILTDTGVLYTNTGAVLNVAGTFDVQTDTGISVNNAPGQMNVLSGGVLKKSAGTGTSGFNIAVDNDGSVQALSGTLYLSAGSGTAHSSTGAFSATAGNILAFGGDTQDMSGAASVSGAGTIQQVNGTTTFAGTTWNVSGQTNVSGGTVNFNAAASTVNGTQTGAIGGSGVFTIFGTYTWSGGSMQDTGTTQIATAAHLTINTGNNHFLGRTLNVAGGSNAVLTDTGVLYTNTGAILNVGGTFDVQSDTGIAVNNAPGQLNVVSGGLLKKSAGLATSGFNIAVANSGTVNPITGTLSLTSSLTNNVSGHLNITAGGTLSTSGTFSNKGTIGVEISGAAPGTTGLLHFAGAAPFAGTLAITRTGSTPVLNQTYTFATYSSHSGKFKTITGQSIALTNMAYLVTLGTTSATLTVRNSADTSLAGTFPTTITHGTAYSYVYTIGNSGPMPATKIIFTDSLPAGVTFVSATSSSGTCTSVTTSFTKVTCKPTGSLAIGATVTITINVTAPGTAGTITNKPSVKSFEADVNTANNALTQKTTVT